MTVLLIGYPNSGKSAIAEDMVIKMSEPGERIYLATMIPYGEEGAARVENHRKMREGKGFTTLEAPFDIADAVAAYAEDVSQSTVLLECLSNLAANEMFERHNAADSVIRKLKDDILELAGMVKNLIIVSNSFEEADGFDEDTLMYVRMMDSANESITSLVDKVIRI